MYLSIYLKFYKFWFLCGNMLKDHSPNEDITLLAVIHTVNFTQFINSFIIHPSFLPSFHISFILPSYHPFIIHSSFLLTILLWFILPFIHSSFNYTIHSFIFNHPIHPSIYSSYPSYPSFHSSFDYTNHSFIIHPYYPFIHSSFNHLILTPQ